MLTPKDRSLETVQKAHAEFEDFFLQTVEQDRSKWSGPWRRGVGTARAKVCRWESARKRPETVRRPAWIGKGSA